MKILFRGPLALLAMAAATATVQAEILLQDDFNDNVLDTAKWQTDVTALSKRTGVKVEEVNQRIELTGRGYLITQQQFDPLDYDTLQITGTWTFPGGDDMLQILTRSDAVPTEQYGETQTGVEFRYQCHDNSFAINSRNVGVQNLLIDKSNLKFAAGDSFNFIIQDDGENLYFKMVEVGDATSWAMATATCTTDTTYDYIVFHNRENPDAGTRRSNLDNVVIASVPEPGTFVLFGAGLLAALAWSGRRRRSSRS